jgi:hypothetical protein
MFLQLCKVSVGRKKERKRRGQQTGGQGIKRRQLIEGTNKQKRDLINLDPCELGSLCFSILIN